MKVTVKLYASLAEHLPAGARDNAVELEVEDGATVDAVLGRLRLPPALVHLVLVDGVFVPPEERGRPLRAGQTIAVWPPIAGG